ncbi:GH1 family beta-glucosidase [Granulicella tundricola]|uniref:Beta-glucosidase n=1 Tax=Granulicella tundricola (strain ATCC BAA-1859 / DSM 23138 / MP5ACTX9) TaxID=1198114 RepID=E8X6A1_GRATM|nr:GH1 family beta-glucosidase [Granulicella tundricola]ADW70985.1 beta-galactosidase [Granulicella tundricola MP5ACTX9]
MSDKLSRRSFAKVIGGSTAALSLANLGTTPASAQAAPAISTDPRRHFPQGFLWGSATASYQVEGAVKEGGRGPSIWDTFSHTPGKVANGDTGDVADDYYHRYKEDIALMKDIGLKTCRFSVSWSRIFPTGTGQPNQQGVDFYNRMCDSLLEAGIQPFCTLYHWDLPQTLQDKGGWENKDVAKAFADYAGYTANKLNDRVKHFMTMNEMRSFVEIGYKDGRHAPGLRLDAKRVAQLNHYVVLAHGLSVQAIRAQTKPGTKVGIADNATATAPVIETPEHIEAARKAYREENAMFLTVLMEGRYTDHYLKRLGADAPHFTPEEMKTISAPMDFVGLNVYQPEYVRADGSDKGYTVVPSPASYPHMLSPWLHVGPEGLYWSPRLCAELWNVKEIYITENGASSADVLAPDGQVYDTDRTMFLRNYLTQLQRAVAEGVPVKGYFLWSLLDNFEWADGYDKRFGITYVDFKTQKRTPKLSAKFYKQVIKENRVV